MANKKVVISKINAPSAMRNIQQTTKNDQKISGRALDKNYCSEDYDSITTYVQLKVWSIELTKYLYPPYVECEYVE